MKKEFKTTILLNHPSAGSLSFKLDETNQIAEDTGLSVYQLVTMLSLLVTGNSSYIERYKFIISLENGTKEELAEDIHLFFDIEIEKNKK